MQGFLLDVCGQVIVYTFQGSTKRPSYELKCSARKLLCIFYQPRRKAKAAYPATFILLPLLLLTIKVVLILAAYISTTVLPRPKVTRVHFKVISYQSNATIGVLPQ